MIMRNTTHINGSPFKPLAPLICIVKPVALSAFVITATTLGGCLSVKTHSTIDPIYMTLDVNLKVQLQKELADIFGEIDAASQTVGESQ